MNYDQKLIAAAKYVYAAEASDGEPTLSPADYGVTAALKRHQVEGVSWFIRRYLLGVNVILEDSSQPRTDGNAPQWVALAVVQSYNPRRKVPRSGTSMPDLESCLSKTSYIAAQNSASIHMPRIGYQDGSDRSEWYTVERLLRKYAATYGINIYVYYFRRSV